MDIKNKIPTTADRQANTAAAQALKQTLATAKPGENLQTKLQDPKVSADVVKKTVDATRGGIDVGTAVKSIAPDPDAQAQTQQMKKKMKSMKKEHTFLTFKQYVESREAAE